MVTFAAEKFVKKGCPIEVEELVNIGLLESLNALPRFDPERGKLATFLPPRFRGAMLDAMREADWVPRKVRAEASQLARATLAFTDRHGRAPTDTELAEALGLGGDAVAVRTIERLRRSATAVEVQQLDAIIPFSKQGVDKPRDVKSELADERAQYPTARLAREDARRLLLRGLTQVERLIVIGYYLEGRTMKEIGADLELSESRVSQLHSQILPRLAERLKHRREELFA
jgi:RNA polymerase sigma factor for flagellar operon FliA